MSANISVSLKYVILSTFAAEYFTYFQNSAPRTTVKCILLNKIESHYHVFNSKKTCNDVMIILMRKQMNTLDVHCPYNFEDDESPAQEKSHV